MGSLPRSDRITRWDGWRRAVNRARSRLRCRTGRHSWVLLRNPEVGGARAMYRCCRRCGRERTEWDSVLFARE